MAGGRIRYWDRFYEVYRKPIPVFTLLKSRGLTISKVTLRGLDLDGLNIAGYPDSTLPKTGRIFISDFKSDYNGRQGGRVLLEGFRFCFQVGIYQYWMGEITYTGLQTGIDIEPEESDMVAEYFFDSCLFENNRNTNIAITSGEGIARNIYFTHCKSYNIGVNGNEPPISLPFHNISLGIGRHVNPNFTDCEFRGYVEISESNATSMTQGYKFMRCLFTDCFERKVSWLISGSTDDTLQCALVRQEISFMTAPLVFSPFRPGGNKLGLCNH